jgi:hypothetical protein
MDKHTIRSYNCHTYLFATLDQKCKKAQLGWLKKFKQAVLCGLGNKKAKTNLQELSFPPWAKTLGVDNFPPCCYYGWKERMNEGKKAEEIKTEKRDERNKSDFVQEAASLNSKTLNTETAFLFCIVFYPPLIVCIYLHTTHINQPTKHISHHTYTITRCISFLHWKGAK